MVGPILFAVLAIILIASGIGMLISRNAVHAAMFLVVNFTTVALFYLGLNAPFLAMVQITVYAGAIMVLFLFVIMLLGAERVPLTSQLRGQVPLAIVMGVSLLLVALLLLLGSGAELTTEGLPLVTEQAGEEVVFGSPASMGIALFTRYALPMQMVAILLLIAMIGAVVLARNEDVQPKRVRKGPGADEYLGGGD